MNCETINYVRQHLDDALTRIFYDDKANDFNDSSRTSVYICTYKNKLVTLVSNKEFKSNFKTCIELRSPILHVSKKEHVDGIFRVLNSRQLSILERCTESKREVSIDYLYNFFIKNFSLKCQDYFDNFLTNKLHEIHQSKEFNDLVNILARKLTFANDYADEFETSVLIGDVIRSIGLVLSLDEINEITDRIFTSNVLSNRRFNNERRQKYL